MRWRIDLAYDGTDFRGWALQPGHRTVQGVLEGHIAQVLRLPERPALVVAGRTDAGVHAAAQVCHLDLEGDDDIAATLLRRLTRVLPDDVVVRRVSPAPAGFDARFSAVWRRYCYRLVDTDHSPDPLQRHRVAPVRHPVDVDLFNEAAGLLRGLRDFAAFCKPREGATTIRDLREVSATRTGDGVVEVHLLADAFCHSMVRSLVGASLAVGEGRWQPERPRELLERVQRDSTVTVVPPQGLVLEEVAYPPEDQLAARAAVARSLREPAAPPAGPAPAR